MSELSDAKVFGGIGAILSTFGILVPLRIGFIVSITGFILEVVAIHKISRVLNDEAIFMNYLISIVLTIVGVFVAIFLGITAGITSAISGRMFQVLLSIVLVLFVLCIVLVLSAIFLKKSFDSIAKKLNVSLFSTAALIYLIGAPMVIILVGLIILFIADIIKIIAFFSIPEAVPQPPQPLPPPPTGWV